MYYVSFFFTEILINNFVLICQFKCASVMLNTYKDIVQQSQQNKNNLQVNKYDTNELPLNLEAEHL